MTDAPLTDALLAERRHSGLGGDWNASDVMAFLEHSRKLEKKAGKLQEEVDALRKPYYELLYAVARKYPNETRHQTALRYIQEAERAVIWPDAALASATQPDKTKV